MFVITCALLVMAATQVWSQYTYCFPYGKGEFQDVAFVNRDTGMAIGTLRIQEGSLYRSMAVVMRTTNSGSTWDTLALPPTTGKESYDAVISEYSRLLLHRSGTGMVFSKYAIYTTGDFGRTWDVLPYDTKTLAGDLFSNHMWSEFQPQLVSDSMVYANVGGDGYLRSTNLGSTWMQIVIPDTIPMPGRLCFASPLHGWIRRGERRLFETTDGGTTFRERTMDALTGMQCLNDSILIGYSDRFYVSRDSGATWSKNAINFVQPTCSVMVAVDTNHYCIIQQSEILATRDAGATRHTMRFQPFPNHDVARSMCIADSVTFFAATWKGIIRITNGGFPDTTTSVSADDGSPPFVWSITPNPSHHEADVHITIREPQNVRLTIVTIDGRLVIDRELGVVQPGTITEHLVLPSGAYICTCTVGTHRQTTPISITR